MEASAGLIAGSHNRNELVVIRPDGEVGPKPLRPVSGQICQICGDDVGLTPDGELFVACNECAFPVCRDCYDYERREGSQLCPQCKTRFKRLKGCPRVAGDEEEDGTDDLENEFSFRGKEEMQYGAEAMLQGHMRYGRGTDVEMPQGVNALSSVPLLTNGEMIDDIPPEQHALVPAYLSGGGKRIHPLPFVDPSHPVHPRSMDPSKDLAAYGYGSVAWKDRMEIWKQKQDKVQATRNENGGKGNNDGDDGDLPLMDEARQPLSRKLPIPSSLINPYRIIIFIRLIVLGFFFHYRIMHPVNDAFALWLVSVICEIWFALSWILDQFPKWLPIERETYLDRLSLRYEKEGQPSQLSSVDIFVSTVDPLKEPPLVTANTVLSILAVDYPVDKVSCYVSDDGAAMLTFEALSETSEFAKKWVPFSKKFSIEPRAPEWYFQQKMDYLKDKVVPSFVKERRAMKREYEEFKVRINALVAKAQKAPEEGWTMQDGTPWPGNDVRDHPGMIQVFLGQSGGHDMEGKELPRLVYVSREKRPGFNHHKKAGAMNALVRVSAVLTNAPYMLNLDCDHYINNSKALREAMCFMMDPLLGKKVCYVQFPQRFDGIDRHDRYANRNVVFFDINMKGLDGIQGPIYVGTGCVFRRQALYGFDAPKTKKPPTRTCNCLPKWLCCGCCCSGKRKKKATKNKQPKKKKFFSRGDNASPVFALEGIEEGIEGIALFDIPPKSFPKSTPTTMSAASTTPVEVEECRGVLRVYSDGSIVRSPNPSFPVPIRDDGTVEWKDVEFDPEHRLSLRLYKPRPNHLPSDGSRLPIFFYFHGGGFCIGSRTWPNCQNYCLRLASELRAVVVAPDYRLAPENRLPAAVDDSVSAVMWLRAQATSADPDAWLAGVADFGRVFISGDSAGGTIAHHLAVRFDADSLAPVRVRGYVLLGPFFGGTERTKSEAECPEDAFLSLELNDRFWRLSVPPGASTDHPLVNPFGPESVSLEGVEMEPMVVVVGGCDLLRDRAVEYAERLKGWGKAVEVAEFGGQQHGFFTIDPWSAPANELMLAVKRFVDEHGG